MLFVIIKKVTKLDMLIETMKFVIGVTILIRYLNLNKIFQVLMGRIFTGGFINIINFLRSKKFMKVKISN